MSEESVENNGATAKTEEQPAQTAPTVLPAQTDLKCTKLVQKLKQSPRNCEQILEKVAVTKTPWYLQTSIRIPKMIFFPILLGIIIIFSILLYNILNKKDDFENKEYDPFGTGIRFSQRRDDTGSPSTSLNERKYQSMVSQLTSNPESPNFSEYYGIDASIKNGSVMIERENFENSALSLDELEKANKGL